MAPRERETMRGDLPSLRAHLRVAGRGRGWGVYRLAPLAASLLRHPPPPTPPHRFAGGGEEMFAMTAASPSRRLLRRVEPGIDAALESGERFQAFSVRERQHLHQDHA